MKKTIAISGGFDPVHIGHLKMIKGAAQEGSVIVILNSDSWLEQKKGYVFMPFEERKEMMESLAGVNIARGFDDKDNTACDLLMWSRATWPKHSIAFGNGGDRNMDNVPEQYTATELNIQMVWGVGGVKAQSSSTLVEESRKRQ